MTTNPEQRWIPMHHDGRAIAGCRRHVRDCIHFYPEADPAEHRARSANDPSARVSYKREASAEELASIPACSTCGVVAERPTLVTTCRRCHMELPVSGMCPCGD